jgi:hypothetical protein
MSKSARRLSISSALILAVGILAEWGLPLAAADDPAAPAADAAAPAASEAPAKYHLAFKFQPGQVVRYEVTQKSEITTVHGSLTEVVRNESETRRAYKVADVTKTGEGDLELSIEWVHMIARFDDTRPIEFQSDDPAKQPAKFKHILETIGHPQARIRFSPTGLPLKVSPIKSGPAAGAGAIAGAGPAAAQGSGPFDSADASRESYLVPLPEQPVAVGDSWTERFDVVVREDKLPVRIAMQRKYTLSSVADGKATIAFRTAILTPVQAAALSAQLMQRETAGKLVFDMTQGLIVSRDVAVDSTVREPFGIGSSMRASSTFREKLLPPVAAAAREAPTTTADSKK